MQLIYTYLYTKTIDDTKLLMILNYFFGWFGVGRGNTGKMLLPNIESCGMKKPNDWVFAWAPWK